MEENIKYSNGKLTCTAQDFISINGLITDGELKKAKSNAANSINTNGNVAIKNCTFGQIGYNSIEIGLATNKLCKNVTIENCEFSATLSNNAILVFATQDNAIVKIKDCNFYNTSNVFRLSNRTSTHVTVIFENCDFGQTDLWYDSDDPDKKPVWHGAVICQDYNYDSNKVMTKDEKIQAIQSDNRFNPELVTFKFNNCRIAELGDITSDLAPETICGTLDTNQILYLWNNYEGFVPYSDIRYPKIYINNVAIN